MLVNELLKSVKVVPVNIEVVGNVLGENARIVDLLNDCGNTVIEAVNEDDLLSVGCVTGSHDSKGRNVVTVLCKESPVGCVDCVNHKLCKLNHLVGRRSYAVADLSLLKSSLVNVGIAVTENVRAVCAHIVDELVAVNIPEVCTLSLLGEEGPCADGNEVTFSRAEMTVNT